MHVHCTNIKLDISMDYLSIITDGYKNYLQFLFPTTILWKEIHIYQRT